MLSGETSVGKWPLRAAETMSRVAQHTNDYLKQKPFAFGSPHEARGVWRQFAMLAEGARVMASGLDAKLVVVWGALERAAYLSRSKAPRPILLFADNERQLRRSALLFGVTAVQLETPASTEAFLVAADQLIQERGWANRGDTVLVLIPTSLSATGAGNTLLVHRLGDPVGGAT